MIDIQLASDDQLSSIMKIVQNNVQRMNQEGNYQWHDNYSLESDFLRDIEAKVLYVAILAHPEQGFSANEVIGCIAITTYQPPEYLKLSWRNDCSVAIVPHRLAVSPHFQKKGIAQLLMQHVEIVAKEKSIQSIRVDTNILNHRMQHIFQKLGYVYVGNVQFLKGEYGYLEFLCYEKLVI